MTVQKSMVRKAVPKTVGSGSGKAAGAEPVKISHTQMWMDLLAAGVHQQPNDVLLALWKQLSVGQHFQQLLMKGSSLRLVVSKIT